MREKSLRNLNAPLFKILFKNGKQLFGFDCLDCIVYSIRTNNLPRKINTEKPYTHFRKQIYTLSHFLHKNTKGKDNYEMYNKRAMTVGATGDNEIPQ